MAQLAPASSRGEGTLLKISAPLTSSASPAPKLIYIVTKGRKTMSGRKGKLSERSRMS